MSIKKHIPSSDWQEKLLVFSYGNQGRITAVASEGMTVLENKRLKNINYDPDKEAKDLVITLYEGIQTFQHKVNAPSEIYIHENRDGKALLLEIVDQKSDPTYIRLYQ